MLMRVFIYFFISNELTMYYVVVCASSISVLLVFLTFSLLLLFLILSLVIISIALTFFFFKHFITYTNYS